MSRTITGRYECMDRTDEMVYLRSVTSWHRPALTQRQCDAVDFSPRVGMQFDMTWEFRPTGRRSGGGQQGTIHITAICNVTE